MKDLCVDRNSIATYLLQAFVERVGMDKLSESALSSTCTETSEGVCNLIFALTDEFIDRTCRNQQAGMSIEEANLIEAAPDLLVALEGLLENERQASFEHWLSAESPSGDAESVHSQWLESSSYSDFMDLYGDEIAAVAKAKGQSK